MLIAVLLVITIIILIIVIFLAFRLIDELRNQPANTKDEDTAEAIRLLTTNLILNTFSTVVVIFLVFAGYSAMKPSINPRIGDISQRIYYKQNITKFWLFIVLISCVVSGAMSSESKARIQKSKLSTNRKKDLIKQINTVTGITWGVAIKVAVTFIFTFVGTSKKDLENEQSQIEQKEFEIKMRPTLTPLVNCQTGQVKWMMNRQLSQPITNITKPVYIDRPIPI